ncbi:MAG: copper resistance CopC family protein, partial [Leifsonia sp.]
MRRALRCLALAGAGATIVVASALAAAPASAHNYPVGSTPAEGATVTVQPDVISLTTNDNLLDFGSSSAIQVSGPSDAPLYYGDGCATVTDATVETTAQLGAPGEYTVQWQVVSTDGHPVSGSFTFDWQPDAS